jgi:unsaturated rhamnogalacturonyl hydrolase
MKVSTIKTNILRTFSALSNARLFLVLLLTFNIILFGFDAYPVIDRKLSRIGIGTLDGNKFEEKVVERSLNWLDKPYPFIINDESRYLLFEYLLGNMSVDSTRLDRSAVSASPPVPDSDWLMHDDTSPLGVLALGTLTYGDRSGDSDRFIRTLEGYATRFIDGENGLKLKPTNVEQTCHGITLTYLAAKTRKPIYLRACDEIANYYLTSFRKNKQAMPYVVWDSDQFVLVDTLGMMCPFLLRYAALTGNSEALELAIFQMEEYFKHGVNKQTSIPFHGYNPARGNHPIGLAAWGRGSGWMALAFQQFLQWMPEDHPKREMLVDECKKFTEALRIVQREDGAWGNMLGLGVAQKDSSATAMICQLFMYGRIVGILGNEFDRPIKLALEALRKNTRKDGTLDFAQGPPVAMNQHSRRWGPNRFGQGSLMLCLAWKTDWEKAMELSPPSSP